MCIDQLDKSIVYNMIYVLIIVLTTFFTESPRRYVEGEVTIHYRSPVRAEAKEPLSEEELARRSAENMRRVYQEERRRKYLQELHDIDSRRHTDNFV